VTKNEESTRNLINTFKDYFDKLITNQTTNVLVPSTTQIQDTQSKPSTPSNMKIGEFIMIDPNPHAYKQLFDRIKEERWIYRGMQVVPGEFEGKDVWFVLFY
jgi:hypothetical protein